MWSYFKGGTLGLDDRVSWWYMMFCTQGLCLCYYFKGPQEGERGSPRRTGRETFCSSHRKYQTSEGKQTSKWWFFFSSFFLCESKCVMVPLWVDLPFLLGLLGPRCLRSWQQHMPVGAWERHEWLLTPVDIPKCFKCSEIEHLYLILGSGRKQLCFCEVKKKKQRWLTSLQLMLRDLAMTWMNRLSLRQRLVPAKSKLISPRRFWAISCTVSHTETSLLAGTTRTHTHERKLGRKSKPFSLRLNWGLSWPGHRTAWTERPLESCPHRQSAQHRSTPGKKRQQKADWWKKKRKKSSAWWQGVISDSLCQ